MKCKLWLLIFLFFIFGVICFGKNDNQDVIVKLNEYKFKISLPSHWCIKRFNSAEIRFSDWIWREKGGVFLVGYYRESGNFLGGSLPNHSQPTRLEKVKTSLGEGHFVVLERSSPLFSNNNTLWKETHVIIAVKGKNTAVDFWLESEGITTTNILREMLKFEEGPMEVPLPVLNYIPPKYDPNRSITYHKPYNQLKDELLYARIITGDFPERKTIRLIRDKNRLVSIVREFDRLKAAPIIQPPMVNNKTGSFVVTMWREGTSVSYVLIQHEGIYYYRETPTLVKKVSDNILKLLAFRK